uniref:TPM domain-containing protein n=1 Tax=Acrobeloides nanus TaxID=290746 RepID=A0A914C6P5_9BILA
MVKACLFCFFLILYFSSAFAQEKWSAKGYPNPLSEYFLCNAVFNQSPNRVCDPDRIFEDQERSQLNDLLNGLEGKTGQTNTSNCSHKGITGVIVLASRINGGTSKDASNMANQLLSKWTFDRCNRGILILLAKDDTKFWTARGQDVPVTGAVFTEIFNSQASLFKQGQFYQGLVNMLEEIGNRVKS